MEVINRKSVGRNSLNTPRILQFGGGNFLRAFFNWMIEELNDKSDFDASVVLVKPTRSGSYEGLIQQEGLFHLIEEGIDKGTPTSQTQLITNIGEIIDPYLNWSAYLQSARSADIRHITSNTTEAGIVFDDDIAFEQKSPDNFPAKLTHWLYERFKFFHANADMGCLILPCELINKNGDLLRSYILQYAQKWELDDDFSDWINKHNFFYNTLVDRIVPGYPHKEASMVETKIGFVDRYLVKAEKYHSWFLEGSRTELLKIPFQNASLNIQWVADLSPYRALKVRLLNGAHTAMVPVAYLLGERLVRTAMANPLIKDFLKTLLYSEIKPTIDLPEETIDHFISNVFDRFANPYIDHQLIDISLNSISKFRSRLLPSLQENLGSSDQPFNVITFSLAALCHFYKGDLGNPAIPLRDDNENIEFFRALWTQPKGGDRNYHDMALTILNNSHFWNLDLSHQADLVKSLTENLESIEKRGMEKALKHLLNDY